MNRDLVSRLGDFKPKKAGNTTSADSMSLTESIIEDAALEWFGELGYST